MRKSTKQSRSRLKAFLIIGLGLLVGAILFFWLLAMPDVSSLRTTNPIVTALIETRHAQATEKGHTIGRHWTWVPLSRISPSLRHAVVAAEDSSFFTHEGFDWEGIKKAAHSTISKPANSSVGEAPSPSNWPKICTYRPNGLCCEKREKRSLHAPSNSISRKSGFSSCISMSSSGDRVSMALRRQRDITSKSPRTI